MLLCNLTVAILLIAAVVEQGNSRTQSAPEGETAFCGNVRLFLRAPLAIGCSLTPAGRFS
jgi:hypothetical protein